MKRELEETRRQGTPMRPLQVYHMHNDPGWIDVPFHWHENAEVLLMQAGALDLQVEGRHYAARPGEVYFINPRELHGMQAASAGCAYLAFVFPLSWLQFAVNDAAEEDCLRPLATRRARADNALPRAAARPAAVLLAQAAALAADPSPAAALALKALLLQFVAGLYRGGLVARRAGADGADPLRRIAGYLQQHCAEPLTLERMGAEFHMSPKYFSAWFQKHFARTFSDYLTAVRIERAKTLLQQTDAGIEWVSQQAGFSGSSYFIRVFRRAAGCTPGQYRRQYRGIRD